MEKIVVVGFGWVGQANALALRLLGFDVGYFDSAAPGRHYKGQYAGIYGSLEKLNDVRAWDSENTWYVVCVGDRVSEEGVQDISNIKEVLESLRGVKGGVILRSTILPDLLEDLPFDFYVPEFLHEKKAVEECVDPYLFVIGKREGVRKEPQLFSTWRQRSYKIFEGTPAEASLIKYLSNLWNSVRIAFVNEFGNTIGRPSDKEGLANIERVINFLFDARNYMRYGRSFGGHCLPKDTRAFRNWYQKKGMGVPLTSAVYESNERHHKLEQQLPLLPEWYSEWPSRRVSGWQALSDLLYSIGKHIRQPSLFFKRQ